MSVLIICGSKSDLETAKIAADTLSKKGIKSRLRICSAHRTPDLLDKIIAEINDDESSDRCQAIIAAAGLSAALPGVVASKTTLPVIGIPLTGAFEGMDALLSVMQMPPGIPVLGVGINNPAEAAETAAKITANKAKKINLVGNHSKAYEKAEATLKQLGIKYEKGSSMRNDALNISFVELDKKTQSSDALTIFCPVAEKETATDALKLMRLTEKGAWVGLNRGENAALAAAQILGLTKQILEYRWDLKRKVEDADKEANK
jgi:5-(carboxyamino)imidazole ribonucleotide mutase